MIQLKIHDESELYNSFDPACLRISNDVYDYLKSFCNELETKKHPHETIQVISDGPVDAEKLKLAIRDAVARDQAEFDRQIHYNHKRAIAGYILGVVLSVAGIGLSIVTDQVLLAIVSFMGTQILAESFKIHTMINPGIHRLKRRLTPFTDFELEIVQKQ